MNAALSKISWYWNRLRCMSAREVLHRVGRSAWIRAEQMGLGTIPSPPEPSVTDSVACWLQLDPDVSVEPVVTAANLVLEGRYRFLSSGDVDLVSEPDWNRNVKTGQRPPMTFGKTIDYRNTGLVGDIKYVWFPNRHLHLTTLAQAYRVTGETMYLRGIALQLDSWLEQCPYLLGPNWTSSLELAIRLVNWSATWWLIGGASSPLFIGEEGARLRRRWLDSVYQHCHFIRGHLSRHSSANNHLIGESAGLHLAALTWPCWPDSARWEGYGRQSLEREIQKQVGSDGVDLEQTVFYQHFVLDFFLICGVAARAAGKEFSSVYWSRVESMLEFIASIMSVSGTVPMIGDADDGFVIRLDHTDGWCHYRSLLSTGARLFNRSDFSMKALGVDDKTRWLNCRTSPRRSGQEAPQVERTLPVRREFPVGGYFILGRDFETEREVRAIVDIGPLGYPSIAAHGHADALSLLLSLGGDEILVDPGTFAYQADTEWRDYFRGTTAHNTVTVDGRNQSEIGGKFMWIRAATSTVEMVELGGEADRVIGSNDGYRVLPDRVTHKRDVEFDKKLDTIFVRDLIDCRSDHVVRRHWHLAEHLTVRRDGLHAVLVQGKFVEVRIDSRGAKSELSVIRGRLAPPLGWIARRFGQRRETHTIEMVDRVRGAQCLETLVTWTWNISRSH